MSPVTLNAETDKLTYFNYLNEEYQKAEEALSSLNNQINDLEKSWYYYANSAKPNSQELDCMVILEEDSYITTVVPNSEYPTTYTGRADSEKRVYCKQVLQNRVVSEQNRENTKLSIESKLRQLYSQRSQIIEYRSIVLQELQK